MQTIDWNLPKTKKTFFIVLSVLLVLELIALVIVSGTWLSLFFCDIGWNWSSGIKLICQPWFDWISQIYGRTWEYIMVPVIWLLVIAPTILITNLVLLVWTILTIIGLISGRKK